MYLRNTLILPTIPTSGDSAHLFFHQPARLTGVPGDVRGNELSRLPETTSETTVITHDRAAR